MNELETNVVCKLTDFGFVKALDKNEKATTILGTANYMAPELVKNQKYDSKVDIWALGVLTYIIMTGTEPFKGRSQFEVFEAIKMKNINYEPLKDFYMKG